MAGIGRILPITGRGLANLLTQRPLCVSFEITQACNADCRHCHRGGPVAETHASAERFAEVFRELRPPVVMVSGGEPLLRKDLLDIIRALKQPSRLPYTILVTNGSLLTPDVFREAHRAGVDAYSISLDYPDERHDEFRMIPGLFNHLGTLIRGLSDREKKMITLNCVVQSDNFRDMLPLAQLALEWGVSMNFSPYTWLRTGDQGYVVHGEELAELRRTFHELLRFQKLHDTVKPNALFLENMARFFEEGGLGTCRAGERFLVVNPDGTLSPCGLIPGSFSNQSELRLGFSSTNSCTGCNTSIRAWTERPFATFFSGIRPKAPPN